MNCAMSVGESCQPPAVGRTGKAVLLAAGFVCSVTTAYCLTMESDEWVLVGSVPVDRRGGDAGHPGLKSGARWLWPRSPPVRTGFIARPGADPGVMVDLPQSPAGDFDGTTPTYQPRTHHSSLVTPRSIGCRLSLALALGCYRAGLGDDPLAQVRRGQHP